MKTEQAINNDREFVVQVIRALPNMDSDIKRGWIENPRGLSKVLSEALCPPWKTIRLGTGLKTADDFRKALKENGNRVGKWGKDILGNSDFERSIAQFETEINLCVETVKTLTGKDSATTREIHEAIKSKGHELCPAEVGPQLRLQYADQPLGEYLIVAMEPIRASDGGLDVFDVYHDSFVRWLHGGHSYPDLRWNGGHRFVFVSRK